MRAKCEKIKLSGHLEQAYWKRVSAQGRRMNQMYFSSKLASVANLSFASYKDDSSSCCYKVASCKLYSRHREVNPRLRARSHSWKRKKKSLNWNHCPPAPLVTIVLLSKCYSRVKIQITSRGWCQTNGVWSDIFKTFFQWHGRLPALQTH